MQSRMGNQIPFMHYAIHDVHAVADIFFNASIRTCKQDAPRSFTPCVLRAYLFT